MTLNDIMNINEIKWLVSKSSIEQVAEVDFEGIEGHFSGVLPQRMANAIRNKIGRDKFDKDAQFFASETDDETYEKDVTIRFGRTNSSKSRISFHFSDFVYTD